MTTESITGDPERFTIPDPALKERLGHQFTRLFAPLLYKSGNGSILEQDYRGTVIRQYLEQINWTEENPAIWFGLAGIVPEDLRARAFMLSSDGSKVAEEDDSYVGTDEHRYEGNPNIVYHRVSYRIENKLVRNTMTGYGVKAIGQMGLSVPKSWEEYMEETQVGLVPLSQDKTQLLADTLERIQK